MEERGKKFDYLMGMQLWKLSQEDKDRLLAASAAKKEELRVLEVSPIMLALIE